MPFDVRDFHDLVRLLEAHPEWRAELRRLVLSEELLRLPELVRELVEAQSRTQQQLEELGRRVDGLADRVDRLATQVEALTAAQARAEERLSKLEERVDRLEEAIARLTEAQARAEERLSKLEERVDRLEEAIARLTEAQAHAEERLARLEEAVARLTEAQARAEERLSKLEERVGRLEIRVGRLEGRDLERYYRERAPAIFGQAGFSRVRVIPIEELASRLDDLEEQGLISPEERLRLLRTDLVIRARSQGQEVWLAVEVSTTVDSQDVERAARSAELLGRIFGVEVRPVVAGHRLLPEAEELGQHNNVLVITDGAAA
jgi:chromosome segregation ATPase